MSSSFNSCPTKRYAQHFLIALILLCFNYAFFQNYTAGSGASAGTGTQNTDVGGSSGNSLSSGSSNSSHDAFYTGIKE